MPMAEPVALMLFDGAYGSFARALEHTAPACVIKTTEAVNATRQVVFKGTPLLCMHQVLAPGTVVKSSIYLT